MMPPQWLTTVSERSKKIINDASQLSAQDFHTNYLSDLPLINLPLSKYGLTPDSLLTHTQWCDILMFYLEHNKNCPPSVIECLCAFQTQLNDTVLFLPDLSVLPFEIEGTLFDDHEALAEATNHTVVPVTVTVTENDLSQKLYVYGSLFTALSHGINYSRTQTTALRSKYECEYVVVTHQAHVLQLLDNGIQQFDKVDQTSINHAQLTASTATRFLNQVLTYAIQTDITDIHFTPNDNADHVTVGVRQFGQIRDITNELKITYEYWSQLLNYLLVKTKVVSTAGEKLLRPATGEPLSYTSSTGDIVKLRLEYIPQGFSSFRGRDFITISIRLIKHKPPEQLEKLRYTQSIVDNFQRILTNTKLHLVCGPTGSGKSTLLTALLMEYHLRNRNVRVVTLEKPVEHILPFATQIEPQMGPSGQPDFASYIPSITRADPDAVLIGEVNSNDTAASLVRIASSGHIAFSTFHANSHLTAILRFAMMLSTDVKQLFFTTVGSVITQRLAFKLCDHCAIPTKTQSSISHSEQLLKKQNPAGCEHCNHTGVTHPLPIASVLTINAEIVDELLAYGTGSTALRTACNVATDRMNTRIKQLINTGMIDYRYAINE